MKARVAILLFLGALTVWFFYIERTLLTPFILAAIFAYIFNPLVNFLTHKVRLWRTLSISLIYLLIIAIVLGMGTVLAKRVFSESSELRADALGFVAAAKLQVNTLPDWLSPAVDESLNSIVKSKFLQPSSLFSLFPAALSRIVSFIAFLFSAFYFLKEGKHMRDTMLHLIPKEYRIEVEILIRKINVVLGDYLRGQLFLVLLVAAILFIALSILGVRYALILAVFSGFAEIVPLIGPITAGVAAVLVVLFTDSNFHFAINQFQAALIVVAIYFVVRQIEDYFVIPHVMGKITKLHPLVILFTVLAGGHLFGVLGFLLAVPIAASLRITFAYLLDKLT